MAGKGTALGATLLTTLIGGAGHLLWNVAA
jgi:hypothetical protein